MKKEIPKEYFTYITNQTKWSNLSEDEKNDIAGKVDNFLEALYINPTIFHVDDLNILKLREEKLNQWKQTGTLVGAGLFSFTYFWHRFNKGFFFKNGVRTILGVVLFGYFAGRFSEFLGNYLYYQNILTKLAVSYNITDSEVEDLHVKMNEAMLKQNQEVQSKSGSLDNVKFKF